MKERKKKDGNKLKIIKKPLIINGKCKQMKKVKSIYFNVNCVTLKRYRVIRNRLLCA